jgi:cytochrome oxidase Cu insertion factor (SCO1/SenC/PrrC family)
MRNMVMAAVAVLVLAMATLGLARWLTPPAEPTAAQADVAIGGPFTLTDQNGREVKDAEFRGRLMLVYFGYTYCPDMCPLGLTTLADAVGALPPELQDQVVPVFITVDPARDTVPVMHDYVGQFSPRLVGLTGSEAAIADTLRGYRVYASKSSVESADGRYLVDHSTFTYLMGRDGKYLTHFGHSTTPEEMAKRIEEAIAAG